MDSFILHNIKNTNFTDANLTNAKIRVFGDSGNTRFNNANLTNAKVTVYGSTDKYFNNANLTNAKVTFFSGGYKNTYFNNANLAYATLTSKSTVKTLGNFTGAILLKAKTDNIPLLDPIIDKQNETFKYMADIYALLKEAARYANSIFNPNNYFKDIINKIVEILKNLCVNIMRSSVQVYLLSIR